MSDIRIVCGDPEKGPASFTRFVLPFAYKLEKCDPVADGQPFYQPVNDVWQSRDETEDFVWRRRYLTDETEEVLFRRAKWFTLKNWSEKFLKFELVFNLADNKKSKDNGKGCICISPPRIVLFECQDPKDKDKQDSENSILQSGFLIIEVSFPKNQQKPPVPNGHELEHDLDFNLDDLMHFNELFRYWQKPFSGHEHKGDEYIDENNQKQPGRGGYAILLGGLVGSLMPDDKNSHDLKANNNIYFDRWQSLLTLPVKLEKGEDQQFAYYKLFPDQWARNTEKQIRGESTQNDQNMQGRQDWLVHADNRAFVWTCALIGKEYKDPVDLKIKPDYGANVLKNEFNPKHRKIKSADYGYWTKLLNVDSPGGNSCRDFEKKWTNEHTYKRWEEWGTFYGYTPHSGAMLGAPLNEKIKPFGTPMWQHFGGMYFDQTLLLLYLKTTLFRFSLDLNRITAKAMGATGEEQENWVHAFQELRWQFTLFTNLYQFPMLSNQQQGLEMYTLQRKQMEVDDLFREMKEEIHSSYEFLMVKQDREQTEQGARLNVVATLGVVGALAFGFLGINILVGEDKASWHDINQWLIVLFVVFVFWCITKLIIFYSSGLSKFFSKLASCGQKESETICRILKGGGK